MFCLYKPCVCIDIQEAFCCALQCLKSYSSCFYTRAGKTGLHLFRLSLKPESLTVANSRNTDNGSDPCVGSTSLCRECAQHLTCRVLRRLPGTPVRDVLQMPSAFFKVGFPSLGTAAVLGSALNGQVRCGVLSSSPVCPADASSLPPKLWQPKTSPDVAGASRGATVTPLLGTTALGEPAV